MPLLSNCAESISSSILALFLSAIPVAAQSPEVLPKKTFDRVVKLVLPEADPEKNDGWGSLRAFEFDIEFEGTMHIWAISGLDLILQVDDNTELRPIGIDDNAGGGTTPYLAIDVKPGDRLVALVGGQPGEPREFTLHLAGTTETKATRTAAQDALKTIKQASALIRTGQQSEARTLGRRILSSLLDTPGASTSDSIARALAILGSVAINDLADNRTSSAASEKCLVHFERTLPVDHNDLQSVRASLALAMRDSGDLVGARTLQERVLASCLRSLPADHLSLAEAKTNLAATMFQLGELAEARALQETVLELLQRTLPEENYYLLIARADLALSLWIMGELADARALQELVLEISLRTLPDDHPMLSASRTNLSNSMSDMGDLAGVRDMRERVLATYERTLPDDHPMLLIARANLAVSLSQIGDLAGARAQRQWVLEVSERILPKDHPDLLRARINLAASLNAIGDLTGARVLQEKALAGCERSLPEDHPDLLLARANLAVSMLNAGDFEGARALQEAVLAGRARTLPEDHPDLLIARGNLAACMGMMGDLVKARALQESVLESLERTMPEDHPDLLLARSNLATYRSGLGDLAGARALQESVISGYERTLPENHPNVLMARGNLAFVLNSMGELVDARAVQESVLIGYERTLPPHHRFALIARGNLINMLRDEGNLVGARAQLPALIDDMTTHVMDALALAPRQAVATVARQTLRLSYVLFFSESGSPKMRREAFELTETLRMAAGEAARSLAGHDADPELAPILAQAATVRRSLSSLIAGASRDGATENELASELTRLSLARDRLESQATRLLASRGVFMQPVKAELLSAQLEAADVAVGYRFVRKWYIDETNGRFYGGPEHLFAHVLTHAGSLTRLDLGAAAELEQLASSWRTALGSAIGTGISRGYDVDTSIGEPELPAGRKLRARILDPILDLVGTDVRRLFVCADDLLFLLPLDALPMDTEESGLDGRDVERIGDRLQLINEVSFARLLEDADSSGQKQPPNERPSLLAFGGVDYNAQGTNPENLFASSPPIEEVPESNGTRSAAFGQFQDLVQSRLETEAIADLFEEAFELEPTVLTRERTTKAALFTAATDKRYLHLATHGWFAPESIRSKADANTEEPDFMRMGLEERISGLAPMTLCGLALAGANRGRDSLGRVTGILTAEELCSLDLSQCELAVLSACETNVGIRRAGQGIQSLQSALYAAGARTSITSLWKVDDAATRRLFEVFYTNLWIEGMPKAESLWSAKQALRDEGHPPADWAGWVLTGDPD